MLQLSVNLYQSPIYLAASVNQGEDMVLSGSVQINSVLRCSIPGLEIVFVVTIERREVVGGRWSSPEIVRTFQTTVIESEHWVENGDNQFEFKIYIDPKIPYSRTTYFDRVAHHLYAIIPESSPSYDQLQSNTSLFGQLINPFTSRSLKGFRGKSKVPCHPISGNPVTASSNKLVQVYGPKSYLDEIRSFRWDDRVEIPELGLDVSLKSDENPASLGSPFGINLTFHNLPDNLTLHGWTMSLHQVTMSHAPDDSSHPARSIFTDTYTIGGENQVTSMFRMPGRQRPRQGSYIWRGSTGLCIDAGSPTSASSSSCSSTSSFSTTLSTRLPSPVIGGIPSCSGSAEFASIQHTISLTLAYSVLGEDLQGNSIPGKDGFPVEGAIRSWVYNRPIHILSDLYDLEEAPLPVYSKPPQCGDAHKSPFDSSSHIRMFHLPHMVTMTHSKMGFMRPAGVDIGRLSDRIEEHRYQTAGLCTCFEARDGIGKKGRTVMDNGQSRTSLKACQ